MKMRTEAEIKAYVDGYNAAYNQFLKCFEGRKNLIEAIKKIDSLPLCWGLCFTN